LPDPISYHSKLAESWSSRYSSTEFRSRIQVFAKAIKEFSASGQHWLDAGCGTGEFAELLQGLGRNVSAVDASPEMVKRCKVPATVADIEHLPYADETFDGILCSSVLEYLERPQMALREFHRVLKPNSTLLVSVPNSNSVLRVLQACSFSLFRTPRYMEYSRNAYSAEKFNQLLSAEGFSPQRAERFGATFTGGRHIPFGYSLRLHIAMKK
jgi:ubiquinone/menaquinone biosynthesis C-methylase UbiE